MRHRAATLTIRHAHAPSLWAANARWYAAPTTVQHAHAKICRAVPLAAAQTRAMLSTGVCTVFTCLQDRPCTAQPPVDCDAKRCTLVAGKCTARNCSLFSSQPEDCIELSDGCSYDPFAFECYRDDPLAPCDGTPSAMCRGPRCVYDSTVPACRDAACLDLPTAACTTSSSVSCKVDVARELCVPTEGPLPCQVFDGDADGCPSDRCVYDAFGAVCHKPGALV